MHFIEQLFGISPDGGSGATELLYGLVVVAAVLLGMVGRRLGGTSRRRAR